MFLLTFFSWTVNVPFQSFFLQGCDLCVVWFPRVNVLQAFAMFSLFLPGVGRGWGRFWNLPLLGKFAVFNYKGDLREDRVRAPCSPSALPCPRQASGLGHKQPQPFASFLCKYYHFACASQCLPGASDSKESTCSVGDLGIIPGLGRSPGQVRGNPLQYSCLENPTDRGAWQATVRGVTQSWTRLSD